MTRLILQIAGTALIACAALTACKSASKPAEGLAPLDVTLTTHLGDEPTLRRDESLSLLVSLSDNAHILLLLVRADGRLQKLLPNSRQHRSFFSRGEYLSVPPAGANYRFRVSPPPGKEVVWLFATSSPLPQVNDNDLLGGIDNVRRKLKQSAAAQRARYGEASVSFVSE